jgi:hypothetical protein
MSRLWGACKGSRHIQPLALSAIRVVESQGQAATLTLVDSLEEQMVLESLLENVKPPLPETPPGYHYLLTTPFRYPPLPYGSRFGSRLHNGIFYASLTEATALAETAYYRFVFWQGMATPPPRVRLTTELTTFSAKIKTNQGVRLEAAPFEQYTASISHPSDYQTSQALGDAMRDARVEAFTYVSARDPEGGINCGCFTIAAIAAKKPSSLASWTCVTNDTHVTFLKSHALETHLAFSIEGFLVDGQLASPAC